MSDQHEPGREAWVRALCGKHSPKVSIGGKEVVDLLCSCGKIREAFEAGCVSNLRAVLADGATLDELRAQRDEARAEVEGLRAALRICYECGSRPVVVSTAREALRESEAGDE